VGTFDATTTEVGSLLLLLVSLCLAITYFRFVSFTAALDAMKCLPVQHSAGVVGRRRMCSGILQNVPPVMQVFGMKGRPHRCHS
jgi:hypothetical protein